MRAEIRGSDFNGFAPLVRPARPSFGYDVRGMETFIQGWGLTIALCSFIVLVFIAGWLHVHRELSWVKALTDHLGDELVGDAKPKSLEQQALRDEAHAILHAKDP